MNLIDISKETLEIIERIKEIRKNAGLSQAKFARVIGVSPGNVGTWETGGSLPGAIALKNIAQKFGCSVDWILTGKESSINLPTTQKIEVLFDPDLKRMIDVLKTLMESDNQNLRGWAIIQFENAFREHCAAVDEKKQYA